MSTNKVQLHRVIAASREKVFRAFTEPDALASWLPPYGFVAKVHSMDVKVGGSYKMSFINFTTGNGHSFGGESQRRSGGRPRTERGRIRQCRQRFGDQRFPAERHRPVLCRRCQDRGQLPRGRRVGDERRRQRRRHPGERKQAGNDRRSRAGPAQPDLRERWEWRVSE